MKRAQDYFCFTKYFEHLGMSKHDFGKPLFIHNICNIISVQYDVFMNVITLMVKQLIPERIYNYFDGIRANH